MRPTTARARATRDANGVDFWWDEEEGQDCDPDQPGCVDTETVKANCWSGNIGPNGGAADRRPAAAAAGLPRPRQRLFKFPNINKLLELLPCATWDPQTNTDPPGCNWFTTPPEPN